MSISIEVVEFDLSGIRTNPTETPEVEGDGDMPDALKKLLKD